MMDKSLSVIQSSSRSFGVLAWRFRPIKCVINKLLDHILTKSIEDRRSQFISIISNKKDCKMKLALFTVTSFLTSAAAFAPARTARVSTRVLSSLSRASLPEHSTPIKEGDSIPSVTFRTRSRIESDDANPFDWKDVTSEDYFKGKKVAIFSLPGAFTPTCSTTHLPGYEAAYEEMKSLGVDEVYCLSVNDAFVMRQWGIAQG